MTNEEMIRALREKKSRDNRKLLDEAADKIEGFCILFHLVLNEVLPIANEIEKFAKNKSQN